MGGFHVGAGFLWSVSFFIFVDGAVFAKSQYNDPMSFVDCLGLIFGVLGMMIFTMIDIRSISGGSGDDDELNPMVGSYGDEGNSSAMKARVLFFIAAFFMLTGFSLAVWRLVYWSNDSRNHPWVGWSELLQSFLAMISAGLLLYGNYRAAPRPDM